MPEITYLPPPWAKDPMVNQPHHANETLLKKMGDTQWTPSRFLSHTPAFLHPSCRMGLEGSA